MVSGSLMIRLIDIVLIILLGFLTISDFSLKTQIKLPKGGDSSETEEEVAIIVVKIMPDKAYYIDESVDELRMVRNTRLLEAHLAARIKEHDEKNQKIMVVVEPHMDTELQLTVDVLDVCENLQIAKTISYPNLVLPEN